MVRSRNVQTRKPSHSIPCLGLGRSGRARRVARRTNLLKDTRVAYLARVPVSHTQRYAEYQEQPVERDLSTEKEIKGEAGDDDERQHHHDAAASRTVPRFGAHVWQRDEHGQHQRVEEGKVDNGDHPANVVGRRLVRAAGGDGEGHPRVANLHDSPAGVAMAGEATQLFHGAPLLVAMGVDVDAAEDAVAERLPEGLGALEGAPACFEGVKFDLTGRLWGAECPDEDSGDETHRKQEVPRDSRLDRVWPLCYCGWHFVVTFGRVWRTTVAGVAVVVSRAFVGPAVSYPCLGRWPTR